MTSIRPSSPGLDGYIVSLNSTGSPPESLRHLGRYLSRRGFTWRIYRGVPVTQLHDLVAPGTSTGWLLTWSRGELPNLEHCGNLWVADGEAPLTPFTLTQD